MLFKLLLTILCFFLLMSTYVQSKNYVVMLRFGFIDFDRFFDQQFDLDSIRFRFFNDLHTSVDPTRFVCGRVGTAVLRCWPPTKLSPHCCRPAVVVGLNREDVEWAKYRSNSVAL